MARRFLGVGVLVFGSGCKAIASMGAGDSGAPAETVLETKLPSPMNAKADFKVGDDVAILEDDGAFKLGGTVEATGGQLVSTKDGWTSVTEEAAKPAPRPWPGIPTATATAVDAGARTAARGYKIRMPKAKGIDIRWLPSTQVFPPPWVPVGSLTVGDSFHRRRFGNFVSPKCVVTEARKETQGWLTAKCEDDERARSIEQKDIFAAFAPVTLPALSDGEIVYVDKTQWAMVVGKSGPRVVVREEGFAGHDKAIDVTRVERVH